MKKTFAILLLSLFAALTASAQSEKRLALVVGNAEYVDKSSYLENPVHDANDVSAKLKTLGFEVTTVRNASYLELEDAIDAFGAKAKGYDVALFYYSGHGVQTNGENYLVPVDFKITTTASVRARCSSVNYLLDLLDESGCPLKIVCLDACRDNPFERSRGFSKGLSGVDASEGTLVSFATAKGKTAADGDGHNSPYTMAFLNALDQPNLKILDFFNTIANRVKSLTQNTQMPWANFSSLNGDFCFNTKTVSTSPTDTKRESLTFTVNGVSFVMKRVEGGSFHQKRSNNEVMVNSFYMGETEVTQALWNAVMGTTINQQRDKKDKSWPLTGIGDHYPMYYINWGECQEFIHRLNNLTNKNFNLPTDVEWEYAARGGKNSKGYEYAGSNLIDNVAWYEGNSGNQTHQVKLKQPNELGLYDMTGNVWEWCNNMYDQYGYEVRGGGWGNSTMDGKCRVSNRAFDDPNSRNCDLGFRLILSE